jgi:hypothetical protein
MKTMILTALMMVSSAAIAATETPAATASTPSTACTKLVAAAQDNKFEEFMGLTTNYTGAHGKKAMATQKFDKMHTKFMDKIKGITCGTEHVGGNNAFVEAKSGDQTRFIPFVSVDGAWKFDAKTYMSFYSFPGHGPAHGKKGM